MQTISGFFGVLAYLIGAFVSNYFLIYTGAVIVFLFAVIPPFSLKNPGNWRGKRLRKVPEVLEALVSDVGENLGAENRTGESNDRLAPNSTNWTALSEDLPGARLHWVGVQTMFIYTFAYIKEVIMGFETTAELTEAQNNDIGFSIGIAFAILNTVGFILPALVLETHRRKNWPRPKPHPGHCGERGRIPTDCLLRYQCGLPSSY
jgi:maltose/moltooligosaccharide transporter